ncbi:HipA N-terminal domain-containing protein [Variovorax sp. VRV01]|nr:HipA N-terminal domain-containing protein [Variovorax sp. VRV01]
MARLSNMPALSIWANGERVDSQAMRDRIASRSRTRTAQPFDLLQAICRDCVGAIQLLGEDDSPADVDRIEGRQQIEKAHVTGRDGQFRGWPSGHRAVRAAGSMRVWEACMGGYSADESGGEASSREMLLAARFHAGCEIFHLQRSTTKSRMRISSSSIASRRNRRCCPAPRRS